MHPPPVLLESCVGGRFLEVLSRCLVRLRLDRFLLPVLWCGGGLRGLLFRGPGCRSIRRRALDRRSPVPRKRRIEMLLRELDGARAAVFRLALGGRGVG